jgi:hypothetical protein
MPNVTTSLAPRATGDLSAANQSTSKSGWLQERSDKTDFSDSNGRMIIDDHIRLLHIQPGKPGDAIQATISITQLSRSPEYEALSYTWGSMSDPQQIEITDRSTGEEKMALTLITANCHAALRRLRHGIVEPRIIWVDSICINQEDIDERNHQITLMTSIYKSAACVIVYLGEEANGSNEAMDWIQEIDEPGRSFSFDHDEDSGDEPLVHSEDTTFPACPPKETIEALFKRPWFTRIWVLQEIHMASKAVVICGDCVLNWDSFIVFSRWNVSMSTVDRLPYVITAGPEKYRWHPSYMQPFYTPAFALRAVLHDSRHCDATDPRDKFFAILPLVQQWEDENNAKGFDAEAHERVLSFFQQGEDTNGAEDCGAEAYETIKADYHLTVTQVFINLGKYLYRAFSLEVLEDVAGPSTLPSLPSWVPDWSLKIPGKHIHRRRWLNARTRTERSFTVSESHDKDNEPLQLLHVEGEYIGSLASVGGECDLSNNTFPLAEWVALLPNLEDIDKVYHDHENAQEALCELFQGYRFYLLEIMIERIQIYHQGAIDALKNMSTNGSAQYHLEHLSRTNTAALAHYIESGFNASARDDVRRMLENCDGRRLFITDTGFLGLGSVHCEVGDCVYRVKGAGDKIFRDRTQHVQSVEDRGQEKSANGMSVRVRFVGGCDVPKFQDKETSLERLTIW